jgi:hypothetical protein
VPGVGRSYPQIAQTKDLNSLASHAENPVNPAATACGSAVTALRIGMQRLLVIHRDLFARMYVAQSKEHYVPMDSPHVSIRFARVIDVMSAIAAAAAVNAPDAVQVADTQLGSMRAALSFAIRNSLARVFGDLAPVWEMDSRKTALAVD